MLKNEWFKIVFLQLMVMTAVVGLQPQPIYLQPQPPQPILCQQNALPAEPGDIMEHNISGQRERPSARLCKFTKFYGK